MTLMDKYSSLFCSFDNIDVKSTVESGGVHHLIVYNLNVPIEEYKITFKKDEVFVEKKTIEGTEFITETGEDAYRFAEMFIDCGYMQES